MAGDAAAYEGTDAIGRECDGKRLPMFVRDVPEVAGGLPAESELPVSGWDIGRKPVWTADSQVDLMGDHPIEAESRMEF